jgi:hypothetical protein
MTEANDDQLARSTGVYCVIDTLVEGGHVTAAETRRGMGVSIRAVYPHLSYEIYLMSRYFRTFASLWNSCLALIDYRYGVPFPGRDPFTGRGVEPHPESSESSESSMWIPSQKGVRFVVHQMSIGSPMEITFVVEGGALVIGAYSAYLFARVLRSPESIGSWLPRLVAGWHQGWREAESEESARLNARGREGPTDQLPIPEQVREVQRLMNLSRELLELHMKAEQVIAVGLPDDLAASD